MTETTRLVIEGVRPLAWGRGRDCTFAGALAAATEVTPHPRTYAELMGLSGLAFRVRWANTDTRIPWCLSCPIGEMPDEVAALRRATGWQLQTEEPRGGQAPDPHLTRERIVAALDVGEPVLAYVASHDMGVIFGYEQGGDLLMAYEYSSGGQAVRAPYSSLGRMRIYLGECLASPPRRHAVRAALGLAVTNWYRERHDGGAGGSEYWYGDAALGAWIRDLDCLGEMDPADAAACARLNAWNYHALKDARMAAARFLKTGAASFDGAHQARLQRLAALYRNLAGCLHDGGFAPAREVAELALAAVRRQQRNLAQARALDAEAVAETESLLAAWSEDSAGDRNAHLRPVGLGWSPAEPGLAEAPGLAVRHDHPGVWLEGFVPRAYRDPAVGVATDVLAALGHQVEYHRLMGFCAAAFDLVFGWYSDAAWVELVPEYLGGCVEAVGRDLYWPARGSRWDAIVRSIRAGRPAFCCHDGPGCITGIGEPDQVATCHLYGDHESIAIQAPVDEWTWKVGIIGDAEPAETSLRENALLSLRRVASGAEGDRSEGYQGIGGRAVAAYRRWIQELRGLDAGEASPGARPPPAPVPAQRVQSLQTANAVMYDRLVDARLAAATFLRDVRQGLPEAAAALGRAADLYEEVRATLRSRRDDCLLGSWTGGRAESSVGGVRLLQADTLEQALRLEEMALAQLAAALRPGPHETRRE